MTLLPWACFHLGLLGEKPRICCCWPLEPPEGPPVLLIMLLCKPVPCVIMLEKPPVFESILFWPLPPTKLFAIRPLVFEFGC